MRYAIAGALLCAVQATALGAASVDRVYAFGDSLNDCCNNPAAPFTNGPESWLVEFSALMGARYSETAAVNYAVGGAQSGAFNAIAGGGVTAPDGLQSQIDRFQADAPAVDADDLAVIWVGTNDIWSSSYAADTLFGLPGLDIVKPLGPNPGTQELAGYIADNVQIAVQDLRDAGFGNALVLTPYDIGDSALFDVATGPAQNTEYAEALRDELFRRFTPGIDSYVLDVVELIRDLQAGAPDNGFTQLTTDPSCSFGSILCADRPQSAQDSFIYFDFVHLTTTTNSEIAAAAAALLQDGDPLAPVPLPAGLVLMLTAVGGFAVMRRRRPGCGVPGVS